MQKWEYLSLYIIGDKPYSQNGERKSFYEAGHAHKDWWEYLNQLGSNGWELVGVTQDDGGRPCWLLLKRPA
jgi:hypothetical protein